MSPAVDDNSAGSSLAVCLDCGVALPFVAHPCMHTRSVTFTHSDAALLRTLAEIHESRSKLSAALGVLAERARVAVHVGLARAPSEAQPHAPASEKRELVAPVRLLPKQKRVRPAQRELRCAPDEPSVPAAATALDPRQIELFSVAKR